MCGATGGCHATVLRVALLAADTLLFYVWRYWRLSFYCSMYGATSGYRSMYGATGGYHATVLCMALVAARAVTPLFYVVH